MWTCQKLPTSPVKTTESMTKHLSVWAMIGMDASIWTSLTFLDFCERRNIKVCADRKTAPWNVRISRPQPNIENCSMPLLAKNITYTNCILLMQYNNFKKSHIQIIFAYFPHTLASLTHFSPLTSPCDWPCTLVVRHLPRSQKLLLLWKGTSCG